MMERRYQPQAQIVGDQSVAVHIVEWTNVWDADMAVIERWTKYGFVSLPRLTAALRRMTYYWEGKA
jgi:hypothetical protein